MAFVKLDCGILDSSIWFHKASRDVFITALLMAEPYELTESVRQIEPDTLNETGWSVPPGWYGFVQAAGIGILNRAGVALEAGMDALRRLGAPEADSRTPDHEGRRLIRIDGGYLVLNFDKYRRKDHTSAARSKRYRERKLSSSRVTPRSVTQAEAEAEAVNAQTNNKRPSLEEVLTLCEVRGLDKTEAERFWHHFESSGWIDKNGHRIAKWDSKLAIWICDAVARKAEKSHHSGNGANTVVLGKELERVIDRMKTIKATYGDHQSWADGDVSEFNTLRIRRTELRKTLGVQV